MSDLRQTIQDRLHHRFSVDAIYVPDIGAPQNVKVKLRLGVAVYGDGMEFIGDEDQLVFLLSDIPEATKKESFLITVKEEEREYHIIKPLQNNGVRAVWSIRRVD